MKTSDDLRNIDPMKAYKIDGQIDIGSDPIIVPPDGISIKGTARDISKIYSSVNGVPLMTSPSGSYSGNVGIIDATLYTNNGGIFDLDNDGNNSAIDSRNVNFGDFGQPTSFGQLSNYRQFFTSDSGFIQLIDGLTLNGAWSGITVNDSIALFLPTMTLFKKGTSFTISDSIKSNINFKRVQPGTVLFDFEPSNFINDAAMSLSAVRSGATNAIPNLPSTSNRANFEACVGIENTYARTRIGFSADSVLTDSVAAGTYDVTQNVVAQNPGHFEAASNGRMRYIGFTRALFRATGHLDITGGNNTDIKVYVKRWNGGAGIADILLSSSNTLSGVNSILNVPVDNDFFLEAGDEIGLAIEKQSTIIPITITTSSSVAVAKL